MKKKYFILGAAAAVAAIATTALLSTKSIKADDMDYRDVPVEYGTLTAGITKTAPVSVKTVAQALDWDFGASEGEDLGTWELQVDRVLVSVGQQVQKGTALFHATSDSVKETRSVLQREIIDTNKDYEVLEAKQKELRLQVSQEYDNYAANANYAGVIYNNRYGELQKRADEAKEAVDKKQNEINENLLELTQAQQELAEARKYLREAEAAVSENYSSRYDNAYYYTVYENSREKAENMVKQLEEETESLTEKNDSLLYEVDEAVRAYHQEVLDLEKEKLAAKTDYDTEIYYSEMASDWYNIQMAGLENALQEARERYESALKNIRVFDADTAQGNVLSAYNGVISDIVIESGNSVTQNDILVILYDTERAAMNVALSEEDYLAVNPEEAVNIVFADYPDSVYTGRIAKVSNAVYDNRSETFYYILTVSVQGDMAGYYEGMSGNVTFMTNRAKEALYVPDKAVYRDGERTYVKMRNEKGGIAEKNVTTGFSDGMNTEIIKGVSEGDVVLMAVY